MGIEYELLCVDCRQYLEMGKVYWLDRNGEPLDCATFDGVIDRRSMQWHKRDEFFGRTIECFLIQHRNHELRFVPEGVDELIAQDNGDVVPIDPDEIIAGQSRVFPDPGVELDGWTRKLQKS